MQVANGVIHQTPKDLAKTILTSTKTIALWQSLTPLGRNEFICWVISAKKTETRARRIQRTIEELQEGKRRPCCWAGCPHRNKIKNSK